MSKQLFNNLFVSSPNIGGFYFLNEGNVFKLDSFDTTGFMVKGRKFIRGYQWHPVQFYNEKNIEISMELLSYNDVHDVLIYGDWCYLVNTSGNEIIRYNCNTEEVNKWNFSRELDSFHINSLAFWNDKIVFSAFGEFKETRGYKGKTEGSGFVQDLVTGDKLIVGLSQPHSLTPNQGNLVIANSEIMSLAEYDKYGELVRDKKLDGYTRGICIVNNHIYVGLSCSRNIDPSGIETANILALDRDTWDELGRMEIPSNEIYAIQYVDEHDDLMHVLANIASSSCQKYVEWQVDRDAQLAGLNQSVADRDAQLAALNQSVAERDAQLAALNRSVAERDAQLLVLNQTVADRDAQLAALNQMLTEREAQLAMRNIKSRWFRAARIDKLARLLKKMLNK